MSEIQGKHLHFDCASGIAGDMCMAALLHAGVPESVITDAIETVGLGDDRLRVESVVKSGIASKNVWVRCEEGQVHSHGHAHTHEHHHDHVHDASEHSAHSHHHYSDIRSQIENSSLAPDVIALCLEIFAKVASAEAKMHGVSLENVAFHEVGAIDSIVDVVGCAAALRWLAPTSVSSSPVAMGKGTVNCAHGILPVPSPAAVEIMREAGAPVTDGGLAIELCTPTGAAILAAVVDTWGRMPELVPLAIGYGAGDLDLTDRPNVLRALVGRRTESPQEASIVEITANIDDMSPELCGHALEALFAAGAVDGWWTPIVMKKGRPAVTLSALCPEERQGDVVAALFRESTSIGLRISKRERQTCERERIDVSTEYGTVAVKVARFRGEVVNIAPEFDACSARAQESGAPLKMVFAAALCQARLALSPA